MDRYEYLTVTEFARIVGTSNQAIYQQLDKRLKPYYKVIDNKKMVLSRAIEELYNKTVDNDNQVNVSTDCQEEINRLKRQIESLEADKKWLQKQIDVKDQQIRSWEGAAAQFSIQGSEPKLIAEQSAEPKKRHWWQRKVKDNE